MGNISNYFRSPKNWVANIALGISLLSFLFTLSNQSEQNERWAELNAPHVVIDKVDLVNFREVPIDAADKIDWGYVPKLFWFPENPDILTVPYFLVAHDRRTGSMIQNTNPVTTISALKRELKRIRFNGHIKIYMHFRVRIDFKNIGKLTAKNLLLGMRLEPSSTGQAQAEPTPSPGIFPLSLEPEHTTTGLFDFELPIGEEIPPFVNLGVRWTYTGLGGETMEEEKTFRWSSSNDSWYPAE